MFHRRRDVEAAGFELFQSNLAFILPVEILRNEEFWSDEIPQ